MKPREINPECIDDDAWWDMEALKLAVVDPFAFQMYVDPGNQFGLVGDTGLGSLHLLDVQEGEDLRDAKSRAFNQARIANFGQLLIAACKRAANEQ